MSYLVQHPHTQLVQAHNSQRRRGSGRLLSTVTSFLRPTPNASSAPSSPSSSPAPRAATHHSEAVGGAGSQVGIASSTPSASSISDGDRGAPKDPSLLSTRMEDAQLYRFAIDYEELLGVMNAPCFDQDGNPLQSTPVIFPYSASASSVPSAPTTGPASDASSILSPSSLRFKRIGEDLNAGITLCSSPVPNCPVHLMRATAIMPCSAADFLQYMDSRVRRLWDTYSEKGYIVRELAPPEEVEAQLALARQQPRTESLQVAHSPVAPSPPPLARTDTTAQTFKYLPGQRRVALHYLAVRSPVPFVQSRDFELVVMEEVLKDGTAYMKAFSAPFGYCVPVDVDQNRHVRAVCLSGVVARPLTALATSRGDPHRSVPPALRHLVDSSPLSVFLTDARGKSSGGTFVSTGRRAATSQTGATSPPSPSSMRAAPVDARTTAHIDAAPSRRAFCEVSYYGLVHPMGMIPPLVANMVISAQLTTLRNLQQFIVKNPLSALFPKSSKANAATHERSSSSSRGRDNESNSEEGQKAPNTQRTNKPSSWRERLLSKL